MADTTRASTREGCHRRAVSSGEPSDHLLLGRFRHGSQDAAQHLYERYAPRVRALARARCGPGLATRVEADDIVQSVFSRFFAGARSGRYDIPEGQDLWGLFLVLALNRIRAEGVFHLAARRDVRMTAALERLPRSARPAEQKRCPAEGFQKLVVEDVLACLPAPHRDVVEKRIAGHAVAEIAQQMGRSKRSVERILQQSRNRLSVLLPDHERGPQDDRLPAN